MTEEQIYYECTSCFAGMEIYKDSEGANGKHRVSFDAPIGKYVNIKIGQMIPDHKCYKCKKRKLIRT